MSPLIHVLLGTKAELIKVAPVLAELDRRGVAYRLVETGQHGAHLPALRAQLGVREPDLRLGGPYDVDSIGQAVRWMAGLAGLLVGRRSLGMRVFGGAGGVCLVHGHPVDADGHPDGPTGRLGCRPPRVGSAVGEL